MSRGSYLHKHSLGEILFDLFNHGFLVLFAFTILFPFWHLFLSSFSTAGEAMSLSFRLWNKEWTADAYRFVLQNDDILRAYANSVFRTVVGTILMLITSLMGAYPLSKRDLPGRNWITTYMLVTLFFSGGLIPYYLLIRSLGLVDSMLVYVIPGMVGVYNMLLTRNFLMAMDKDLEEAAFIDGAGYLTILVRIVAPLTKPILATIALWTAVAQWNSWFDALLFINSNSKIVLQLIIQRMINLIYQMAGSMDAFMLRQKILGKNTVFAQNVRAAAVFITIGPIILVYPFVQKYFIKGIMVGSLKG